MLLSKDLGTSTASLETLHLQTANCEARLMDRHILRLDLQFVSALLVAPAPCVSHEAIRLCKAFSISDSWNMADVRTRFRPLQAPMELATRLKSREG